MDQLLFLTVEHGWSWKQIRKTLPILVLTGRVKFHLRLWFVRLVSQVMMKSLTFLVIAT